MGVLRVEERAEYDPYCLLRSAKISIDFSERFALVRAAKLGPIIAATVLNVSFAFVLKYFIINLLFVIFYILVLLMYLVQGTL